MVLLIYSSILWINETLRLLDKGSLKRTAETSLATGRKKTKTCLFIRAGFMKPETLRLLDKGNLSKNNRLVKA